MYNPFKIHDSRAIEVCGLTKVYVTFPSVFMRREVHVQVILDSPS